MPAFLYGFLVALVPVLSSLFFQLLAALGVGFLTFTGGSAAVEQLQVWFAGNLSGLPATVVGILGLLRVDQAFNLVVSAVAARFTMAGLSAGVRRLVFKVA